MQLERAKHQKKHKEPHAFIWKGVFEAPGGGTRSQDSNSKLLAVRLLVFFCFFFGFPLDRVFNSVRWRPCTRDPVFFRSGSDDFCYFLVFFFLSFFSWGEGGGEFVWTFECLPCTHRGLYLGRRQRTASFLALSLTTSRPLLRQPITRTSSSNTEHLASTPVCATKRNKNKTAQV